MIKIYKLGEICEKDKKRIMERSRFNIEEAKRKVEDIIKNVRKNGDKALFKYAKKFDGVAVKRLRVTKQEIKKAYKKIDRNIVKAIESQIKYSKKFHKKQLRKNWCIKIEKGVKAGQIYTPIESVGLYIPGGLAPYPTVMQILGVAAKVAGVPKIIVCTPPRENIDVILITANILGINEIYKVGGAQAIAAMAYGTETIPKVRKIVGPGNIFVTAAKLSVYGEVDIDMPCGPSEVIIIADEVANPKFVAADMLAKAEHDENAAAVLVTNSTKLAKDVKKEIYKQINNLSRREIIKESLRKYSAIIITKSVEECISFTNEYAPEHLEIMTRAPKTILQKIRNAGSIFLGRYAPVAVGDYASGVNHVLPTCQYAKMFSGVSVDTFMKNSEFQYLTKNGLKILNKKIIQKIALVEGLDAHAASVNIRVGK